MAVTVVRFGVLGPVEAWVDDRPVDLGRARQRHVLGVLLVEANRSLSADQLLDRVWGEAAPLRGRETLYSYLSRLRQALRGVGEVELVRRAGRYELAVEQDAVDLHRFRRLVAEARRADDENAHALFAEASGLWRGEVVAGLRTPWTDALRAEVDQQRLAAVLDHTDVRLRTGRHAEALVDLSGWVAAHPLDERLAGQWMLALYRDGRQADALHHYHRLQHHLADELGTDPGPPLRRLHQRILTADPGVTTPAGPDRRSAVPRQLPAAPRLFTGRVGELAELDRALTATAGAPGAGSPVGPADPRATGGTVVISAIGGAGGIGKTWLALAWANRHLDRFPDGQLFVDLGGFSPAEEPMAPEKVLRGFLQALGAEPDRIPADPDARLAHYRSLVADKRLLIVLDNAATADQVAGLLPGGTTCTVLITSRNRLPALTARHGARPLRLDTLTDAESRTVLTTALGAARVAGEQTAVADLIRMCGGFPLALGVVAARAATEPRLALHEIAAELREHGLDALDDTDPAASLPDVLSWSLRRLTDLHRTAFALLGTAPGPDTGLPAAATLLGLPERDTRTALQALVDASLLDRNPTGRYAMHDLVRDYAATTAREAVPEPALRAALDRVLDFYLHTAHTAERLLHPHRTPIRLDPPACGTRVQPLPDLPAALAWLDVHHPHLLAAQRTAVAKHRHQTVWHLAWVLTTFHWRRGNRHDQLAVWQAAVEATDRLPDPTTRVLAHRVLGYAHAELGHHEDAVECLRQALVLAEQHDDVVQQALTHHALGRAWALREDDRRALEHARLALDLFRALDQPVQQALALNQVGWHAACLGDYDTAREHCRDALTLFRRHENPDGEAATLDSLGLIAHRTGRHDQAVEHYQEALALFRTLGNATESANTLDNLGRSHAALGRPAEARAAWEAALELYQRSGRTADAERVQRQLDNPDAGAGSADNR